jgi:hypothetical protein
MDPQKEIAKWNKITEDRGFGYHTAKNLDAWQKAYGGLTNGQVNEIIDKNTSDYMNAIRDPKHPDHATNRAEFKEKYGQDEKNVRDAYKAAAESITGRSFGCMPLKDSSYESRVLGKGHFVLTNKNEVMEHGLLTDLMKAKWNAIGYQAPDGCKDDNEYVQKFLSEYCVSDLPAKFNRSHQVVANLAKGGNAGGKKGGEPDGQSRKQTKSNFLAAFQQKKINKALK